MKTLPAYILLLLTFSADCFANIILKDYCENKTNPTAIPNKGRESSGFLEWSGTDTSYDAGINCMVTLIAEDNFQLLVAFTSLDLRNSSMDMLNITYDNQLKTAELAGQTKCSNESCSRLMFESGSTNHSLILEFTTSNVSVPSGFTGFKALYTAFDTYNKKTGRCKEKDHFVCKNRHCIATELVCDGHNNCGDNSDESICSVSPQNTVWGITVIGIAVVATVIFIPSFCFLAIYGTRTVIKSVTLPNVPTPLYSAVNAETSNLLTSSGAQSSNYFGSLDCGQDRPRSHTFDAAVSHSDEPSTSTKTLFSQSYHSPNNGS